MQVAQHQYNTNAYALLPDHKRFNDDSWQHSEGGSNGLVLRVPCERRARTPSSAIQTALLFCGRLRAGHCLCTTCERFVSAIPTTILLLGQPLRHLHTVCERTLSSDALIRLLLFPRPRPFRGALPTIFRRTGIPSGSLPLRSLTTIPAQIFKLFSMRENTQCVYAGRHVHAILQLPSCRVE